MTENKIIIPIWKKSNLTVEEAKTGARSETEWRQEANR